jgi:hypothetical protein
MTSKEKEKNIEDPTPAAMMRIVEASKERLGFFEGWVIWYHVGDCIQFMHPSCLCRVYLYLYLCLYQLGLLIHLARTVRC